MLPLALNMKPWWLISMTSSHPLNTSRLAMVQKELFTDWFVPLNLKSARPSLVLTYVIFGVLDRERSKAAVMSLVVSEGIMAELHAGSYRNVR